MSPSDRDDAPSLPIADRLAAAGRFAFDDRPAPDADTAPGAPDRDALRRADPARLAAALAGGRVLPVWRGRLAFAPGAADPVWVGADHPVLAGAAAPVWLGQAGGAQWFAADLPGPLPAGEGPAAHPALHGAAFDELRGRLSDLGGVAGGLVAAARALTLWHARHGFCAACGAASLPRAGGWERACPACGAVHFPRTDPCVIMCVTRGEEVLLGRSPGWPEGMYSCLAGFVEPAETLERAVAREVLEEVGLRVGAVRYLASQPWPFPASLMIGMRAEAAPGPIRRDPAELEDALWLDRAGLAAVFAGEHPAVRPPRRGAIAGHLLRLWLEGRA